MYYDNVRGTGCMTTHVLVHVHTYDKYIHTSVNSTLGFKKFMSLDFVAKQNTLSLLLLPKKKKNAILCTLLTPRRTYKHDTLLQKIRGWRCKDGRGFWLDVRSWLNHDSLRSVGTRAKWLIQVARNTTPSCPSRGRCPIYVFYLPVRVKLLVPSRGNVRKGENLRQHCSALVSFLYFLLTISIFVPSFLCFWFYLTSYITKIYTADCFFFVNILMLTGQSGRSFYCFGH